VAAGHPVRRAVSFEKQRWFSFLALQPKYGHLTKSHRGLVTCAACRWAELLGLSRCRAFCRAPASRQLLGVSPEKPQASLALVVRIMILVNPYKSFCML